jgi:phage regulator Rha-like protein
VNTTRNKKGGKRMNELITVVNGKPVVSSRQVAESFEKNHKEVLRDIDNVLAGAAQNCADLFIESECW